MAQEGCKKNKNNKKRVYFKGKLFGHNHGCSRSPGDILDLFGNSYLPLGFMETDAPSGPREESNTLPKDRVAELPVPKTSSWAPDWLSSPRRARSCVVISWLPPAPCIFLWAARVFPFRRKSRLPGPHLYLGPAAWPPPSFFPCQLQHFWFADSLPGRKGFVL